MNGARTAAPTVVVIDGDTGVAATAIRRLPAPGESVGACLDELVATTTGDLILVDGSVAATPGWIEAMQALAQSDSIVGAVTTLGPRLLGGAPAELAPGMHAAVLAPDGPINYLRRPALELVGSFHPDLSSLSAVLCDFGRRAERLGLITLVAGDVAVSPTPAPMPASDLALLRELYPELELPPDRGPLRALLGVVRRRREGLSVTVDARALDGGAGGTRTYITALVTELARRPDVHVRALVGPDFQGELGDAEVIDYERALAGVRPSLIVHRPQQVFTADDLLLLRDLGERLIVTHQDLIAYRNCAYHEDVGAWRSFQRVTREALRAADGVVLFSRHARDDVLGEQLADPQRCTVVGIEPEDPRSDAARRPAGVPEGRPFLLVLGADYEHKNRPFAIELLRALDGFDGCLVLAGAHVAHGSSRERERAALAGLADDRVVDIGPVDEQERAWLLEQAALVVCASTYEGFGLLPFEAALAGTPCAFAAQSSLAELAGDGALVPWDVAASAARVAPLLEDERTRVENVQALRRAAEAHRWSAIVDDLVHLYDRVLREPFPTAAPRALEALERERELAEHAAQRELQGRLAQGFLAELQQLGPGRALVDGADAMLSEAQQRALLRLGRRRALARATLWPLSLLGRIPAPRR